MEIDEENCGFVKETGEKQCDINAQIGNGKMNANVKWCIPDSYITQKHFMKYGMNNSFKN